MNITFTLAELTIILGALLEHGKQLAEDGDMAGANSAWEVHGRLLYARQMQLNKEETT